MDQEHYEWLQATVRRQLESELEEYFGPSETIETFDASEHDLSETVSPPHRRYRIGRMFLAVERPGKARPWLRSTSDVWRRHVREEWYESREGHGFNQRGLNRTFTAGILTDDPTDIQRVGEELFEVFHTPPYQQRHPMSKFEFQIPLVCIITGKEMEACIQWLDWRAETTDYYPLRGLEEVTSGVHSRELPRIEAGLQKLLKWHEVAIDINDRNAVDRLLSTIAARTYVVLRHESLAPEIETEYIPDCLLHGD